MSQIDLLCDGTFLYLTLPGPVRTMLRWRMTTVHMVADSIHNAQKGDLHTKIDCHPEEFVISGYESNSIILAVGGIGDPFVQLSLSLTTADQLLRSLLECIEQWPDEAACWQDTVDVI